MGDTPKADMNLTLGLILAFGVAAVFGAIPREVRLDKHVQMWKLWRDTHDKEYETNVEEVSRFKVWMENLKKVEEHNAAYDLGLKTFNLEMNQFADLTSEEFAAMMLGNKKKIKARGFLNPVDVSALPSSVNWTSQGYVTPVKNQGSCGSCWAFSTTGSIEGQHYNATGNLISLSEQQLVDCDTTSYGCNGGNVVLAYRYVEGSGSVLESDYPYTGMDGACKASSYSTAATISSYVTLPYGSESSLQSASATIGPISVAIDANHWSFQLYSSGVYYEPACSSYELDHAVLVVGYGTESGSDYWLVKNSWGKGWGLDGYIMMSRNKNNNCGIATDACYPIV